MAQADGSVLIEANLTVDQAEKNLEKLKKKIGETESEIEKTRKERDEASEKGLFSAAELDKEKAKLREMRKELEEMRSVAKDKSFSEGARVDSKMAIPGMKESVTDQETRVRMLQAEYNQLSKSVERYDEKLKNAERTLEEQKQEAGALIQKINSVSDSARAMARAQYEAEKSAERFGARVKETVKSALIFTVMSQALSDLREWTSKTIRTNNEAVASIARLKGALLTLAQPIISVLIPAFTSFVNVVTQVVVVLSRIVSAIFGKTIEESSSAAESLYEQSNALDSVGASAKNAAKNLAAFDEINQLSSGASSGSSATSNIIAPDFSSLTQLPVLLDEIVRDIEIKIRDIIFDWENGKLAQNKDAWLVFLSGLLGAVIGTAFFGLLPGGVIGLLLGISVGIAECLFTDELKQSDTAKELFILVLASILGAVLGTLFLGLLPGGIIGLLLGLSAGIAFIEFTKENTTWDPKNTIIIVLTAILGAVLGTLFLGLLPGGIIGLLLGALISFGIIKFAGDKFDKNTAIASLRIVLFAILGAIFGFMFGSFGGGIVGALIGMTIGFSTVAFDEKLEGSAKSAATSALKIALTTIIGALIGSIFGGGVFGGIIGGAIGLTLGVAVTLGKATIKDKTGFSSSTRGGGFSNYSLSTSTLSIPRLATGSVVPPNREFMAILGDNKTETEIVSPLSTMKQAFMEAMQESGGFGGGNYKFEIYINGRKMAVEMVKEVNRMTQEAGKPVLMF